MMSVRTRLMGAMLGSAATMGASGAVAQAPPMPDAGAISTQIQRSREALQQRDEVQTGRAAVVAPERPPMKFGPGGGPTFLLNKVVFDSSAFITQEELAAMAADYTGRKIDNLGMQRLVQAVNELFAARKLLTAIAYIPQQDLAGGVLRVAIIEGRLGAVKVEGNDRLPTETVMGAIEAQPGAVVDVPAIERDVAWFNKSRNAQIQASLQPGANFGLTDIQLTVLEPPVNAVQVFVDNMGVESVGQYEAGINYQRYGLWGNDDKLTLYGVGAQGNANLNLSYNMPFNPLGGRVGLSATKGRIKIVSGPYALLKVDGDSMSVAANASQPLFVTSAWSLLANGALTLGKSESRETSVLITDNKSVKKTLGATVSYTGAAFTTTIAPNVSLVNTTMNVTGVQQSFMAMNAAWSGLYRLPLDLSLTSSGSFQWATKKLLTSDQLFQIGGPTTVRGYPTNGMAGYGGWYGNFELHHSLEDYLTKGLDGFVFVDQGSVFSTFPQRVDMLSVGAGVGWNTGYQGMTVDLTVALPLMRAMSAQRGLAVYGRVSAKL